jgi:hypothetical protein
MTAITHFLFGAHPARLITHRFLQKLTLLASFDAVTALRAL